MYCGVRQSQVSTATLPRMSATLGRHLTSLSLCRLNCTIDIIILTYLRVVVWIGKGKVCKVLSTAPGTQCVFNDCELLSFGFEFRVN